MIALSILVAVVIAVLVVAISFGLSFVVSSTVYKLLNMLGKHWDLKKVFCVILEIGLSLLIFNILEVAVLTYFGCL